MKQYLFSLCAALLVSAGLLAQNTGRPSFYDVSPDYMNHSLMDFLQEFPSCLLNSGKGQYVGQVDDSYTLYGFGSYIDNSGGQRVGLFRGGQFMFGITITSTSVLVGTENHYVCYSLSGTNVEYVFNNGRKETPQSVGGYTFSSLRYGNGDRYVGEVLHTTQRHGIGIYYYTNGDSWYGEYVNGQRKGFGCLFRADNTLRIGFWDGEEELRVRNVKSINK